MLRRKHRGHGEPSLCRDIGQLRLLIFLTRLDKRLVLGRRALRPDCHRNGSDAYLKTADVTVAETGGDVLFSLRVKSSGEVYGYE